MFDFVPLAKDEELPQSIQKRLAKLPPLSIFRLLANMPRVFDPYLDFATAMYQTPFDQKLRQIALLRAALKVPAKYLIAQYTEICKGLGVTERELEAIRSEHPVTSLSEEANFLCKVADEITLQSNLSNETFRKLYDRYSVEIGSELLLFLSAVSMMGRFMNAARLESEKKSPLEGKTSFFLRE